MVSKLVIAVGVLVCVVAYGWVASPIRPVVIHISGEEEGLPLPRFEGALARNDNMTQADQYFADTLEGPESYELHNGWIYTGVADGRVVRFRPDAIATTLETVFRVGEDREDCGLSEEAEKACGRPLGLVFDNEGGLVIADGSFGLVRVVLSEDGGSALHKEILVNAYDGEPLVFLNTVCVDPKTGIIYFTTSSQRWTRPHVRLLVLEGIADGRLYSYDLSTKVTTLLTDGIGMANGVQFRHDRDELLVVELTRSQIIRVDPADGSILGAFAVNLPGLPDNIRWDEQAQLWWVGMSGKRTAPFSLLDALSHFPSVRRVIAGLIPEEVILKLVPRYGMVIALNDKGEIVQSLQDPSGHYAFTSEVFAIGDGRLLLGSFIRRGVAVVSPAHRGM